MYICCDAARGAHLFFADYRGCCLFAQVVQRFHQDAKRAKLTLKHDDGREKDRKTLGLVIDHCNEGLEPIGLKVAKIKHKDTESGSWHVYYGVVNLNEDDGAAKQDWMSKSEQEFFHKLVLEILDADDKRLEAQEALAIGRDLESTSKLSASDAQRCLEHLTLGSWLAKSDDGYYSLGVRTELQRRYLADDFAKPEAASQEVQEVE